jgi:hypothetical protein
VSAAGPTTPSSYPQPGDSLLITAPVDGACNLRMAGSLSYGRRTETKRSTGLPRERVTVRHAPSEMHWVGEGLRTRTNHLLRALIPRQWLYTETIATRTSGCFAPCAVSRTAAQFPCKDMESQAEQLPHSRMERARSISIIPTKYGNSRDGAARETKRGAKWNVRVG